MYVDDIKLICILAAVIITPIAGILGLGMWVDFASCASQASKMELASSWGPLQDCMVQVDGKFMPLKSYKVVKLRP